MADFTSYTTIEGDRWDEIAYRYLGDSTLVRIVWEANPLVPLTPEIPGGIELFIPLFSDQAIQDFNSLPPWKRPQG